MQVVQMHSDNLCASMFSSTALVCCNHDRVAIETAFPSDKMRPSYVWWNQLLILGECDCFSFTGFLSYQYSTWISLRKEFFLSNGLVKQIPSTLSRFCMYFVIRVGIVHSLSFTGLLNTFGLYGQSCPLAERVRKLCQCWHLAWALSPLTSIPWWFLDDRLLKESAKQSSERFWGFFPIFLVL